MKKTLKDLLGEVKYQTYTGMQVQDKIRTAIQTAFEETRVEEVVAFPLGNNDMGLHEQDAFNNALFRVKRKQDEFLTDN